jgi:hypothetical protein
MVTWWRLRRAHIEMAADAERGGNRARGERREVARLSAPVPIGGIQQINHVRS